MENLVSRDDWLKERVALLEREKAFTRARDALTAERRNLPMVEVTTPYVFKTERGEMSLRDLFDGKQQLIAYHFMYGPDWEQGCPSCSYWIDNFDGIQAHLADRDTAIVLTSNAPLGTLLSYQKRMGWSIPWASALDTSFGQDFGVSFAENQMDQPGYNYGIKPYAGESPGLSVFYDLGDGRIAHSYSTYARGLDMFNGAYHLLDVTPLGRNEDDLPYNQAWVKRHDEYASG